MRADETGGIHEDEGLAYLARVDDRQGKGADRDGIHTDDGILRIQPDDDEMFPVEILKHGPQEPVGVRRGGELLLRVGATGFSDERDSEAGNIGVPVWHLSLLFEGGVALSRRVQEQNHPEGKRRGEGGRCRRDTKRWA